MTEGYRRTLDEISPSIKAAGRYYAQLFFALEASHLPAKIITFDTVEKAKASGLPIQFASRMKKRFFIPEQTLITLKNNPETLEEVINHYNQTKPSYSPPIAEKASQLITQALQIFTPSVNNPNP